MSNPFDKILANIKNPIKREWYANANAHGCRFGSFCETKAGTPQFEAWIAYFGRLGWFPLMFTAVQDGIRDVWTAPCEWPADLSFVAKSMLPSPEPTEGVPF